MGAALPSIITSGKQGWTFVWRSLMAGELIYITVSLRGLLETSNSVNDVGQLFALIVVIVSVGILIGSLIFGLLERSVSKRRGFEQ